VIEERLHHLASEPRGRIALELDLTDPATLAPPLPVTPGAEHEMHELPIRVARRERLVERRAAVDVLLIEQARDDHHRHLQRFFRE
jgi:hypothetical protein